MACSGSETSLISCSYTTPTSSDTHSEDGGVRCPGQQYFIHAYYTVNPHVRLNWAIVQLIEEDFNVKVYILIQDSHTTVLILAYVKN